MGRQSLAGGGGTNMLAKDQTRLRIEKMEAEREQRRINAAASRYDKIFLYIVLISCTNTNYYTYTLTVLK